jgi:hypothetical protein
MIWTKVANAIFFLSSRKAGCQHDYKCKGAGINIQPGIAAAKQVQRSLAAAIAMHRLRNLQ